jgi:DNA-binding NtrC family response regulator
MHDALALPMPFDAGRSLVTIEPSPTLRTIIEQTALRAGFSSIFSYAVPKPALADLCQRKLPLPAVVLLSQWQNDCSLDGWDLLASFMQWRLPVHPIVLLEEDDVRLHMQAKRAGACISLARPFQVQQLVRLLETFGRSEPDQR